MSSSTVIKEKCIFCKNENTSLFNTFEHQGLDCPICGRYIVAPSSTFLLNSMYKSDKVKSYDKHKLIAYLYHNKIEDRAAFIGTESAFDEYKKANEHSTSFLVTPETVENWYPKTFEERINIILLTLAKNSKFVGDEVNIHVDAIIPLFLNSSEKKGDSWAMEVDFIVHYLEREMLIEKPIQKALILDVVAEGCIKLTLSAKAWGIVYDLQKNQVNNKKAFVAMKFGSITHDLREKIKEGIILAGYEPRIMDEIEHNHQIVPEMLYEIKNSRFIIAELSHHNNGAYYEAGYAYGLGKEVIHICSEEALKNELHFDVAQINTVTYKSIDEIPEKLKKRIIATII